MKSSNYIEELLQATPQASGLLFHALKDGNSAYHIGVSFTLRTPASEAEIGDLWRRIQASQPALRSVFLWRGLRAPHQAVYASPRIALDYAPLVASAHKARCLDWLAQSKARPFELDAEVFRIACLHDVAAGTLSIAFCFHHILMDGWSSSLLVSLWVQGLRGQAIPPLASRLYSQQLWKGLDPEALRRSREYWRDALQGVDDRDVAVTTKLLDEPLFRRATSKSNRDDSPLAENTAKAGRLWPQARKAEIEALCRRAGVTPASFVYLCWALTLSKLTFQKTVAFGCAFSGREAALAQNAEQQPLGLFTNTTPLLLILDGAWTLEAALRAMFQTLQRTQAHEKTPPLLIREIAGQREELYDSLVVFDNYPIDPSLQDASYATCLTDLHTEETTHFGLTLTVSGADAWKVELSAGETFNGDPAAVTAAFHAFDSLAADLVAMADHAPIADCLLQLVPDQAQASHLVAGATTATADINAVLQGIRQRLIEAPQNIGLIDGDRPISHGELAQRIAAVQAQLARAGFVAGDRVGVHAPKGEGSTVAILAILFSGGSYFYLNPKDPTSRKQTLLELAGCGIVLCDAALIAELGADSGRLLLEIVERVEIEAPLATQTDSDVPSPLPALWSQRRPEDEFYFIFTSGTTGAPKGISIRNESVANLLDWFIGETGLTQADRVLGLTDLNFDPSVEDLFGSLCVGATLIYPAPRVLQERTAFIRTMQETEATLVNFIPGAIAPLLEDAPRLPAMRLWIFGGEELPLRLRDQLLAQGYAVSNHYGPSETTVDCLSARQSLDAEIAIGWPIQNVVAYCADIFDKPLPPGVRGELWVAGRAVARGYATNPVETARAFVRYQDQTFYRTGDAVTFSPASGFNYLGRIDDQVKINGVRIEPRELERMVETMAEVRASCLLPVSEAGGKRQWRLFVDSAAPAAQLEPRVREHIRRHLPESWTPSRILAVNGFARTLTGKIDRRRLLDIAARQAQQDALTAAAQAPLTDPVEAQVQAIWRDILETPAVASDINFFDAGGDSIKIITLQSQLQQRFARDIGVAVIFEHPTIASFAAWIRRSEASAEHTGAQTDPADAGAASTQAHILSSARSGKNRLADRRRKVKGSSVS
ncbi:Non-ribosomal peptide synthetase modules and related protein [Hahella chejuensis KCTC 2396]|uniref:Non-ribosomal peptide synthetase modules and related protein n=1 Tax=Hahella chejuensis (strain KCTC 2396) TaxID=349521 RepID=Q2SGM9_HAHCH|nr:AMP-binding protein [Hahella chejuensis]ABC30195.1 Non-ribosomal peptide synthetase modules and related protein [Hahella chejuensis KCTC 2396]